MRSTHIDPQREQAIALQEAMIPQQGLIERVVETVSEHFSPQEVFSREQLEEWARMNGFTPPEL